MKGSKRKQALESTGVSKRLKTKASPTNQLHISEFRNEMETLEEQTVTLRANLNNISRMLDRLRTSRGTRSRIAMTTIARTVNRLIATDAFCGKAEGLGNGAVIVKWLEARIEEFSAILVPFMKDANADTGLLALDIYMQVLQAELDHRSSNHGQNLVEKRFVEIISAIIESTNALQLQDHFISFYAHQYSDVQYYASRSIKALANATSSEHALDGKIAFLSALTGTIERRHLNRSWITGTGGKSQARDFRKSHRKEVGDAWISLLSKDLSLSQRKTLLTLVPKQIAASVERLERLSDFLEDSFNIGGSVSLTALSGVFHLIQEKNLDYPDFYIKVYALLEPATLHSRHRAKFLRLLDTFLSSTHLPSSLVASFIKRLSRLSLTSSPATIVAILPFIYNMLKSHPSCTFMIHDQHSLGDSDQQGCSMSFSNDPFKMSERNPVSTRAIDSSLWELETLQTHYHPNVATICRIISEQFTKQAYNLEDFLDHSYASVVASELSKDMKRVPVVEFAVPTTIFCGQEQSLSHQSYTSWSFQT